MSSFVRLLRIATVLNFVATEFIPSRDPHRYASDMGHLRLLVLLAVWPVVVAAASRNVVDHGAVPDGKTLNTAALNQLVAETSATGGGTVVFPAGMYLTGTIYLRSNVTLQLEAGATVLGSTELADYPENAPPCPSGRLEWGRFALICAEGQHDVAIIGQGRINGQGHHPNFTKKDLIARGWSKDDAYRKRPYGLSFVHCRGVRVEGVTLEDLAMWCQDYLDCDDVVVRGVTVDSMKNDYNNDGIDIDGSRRVRVSDCHFNTGDDSICFKSSYSACENIVITNCTGTSLANGVKFGTASAVGFKNITLSNLTFDRVGASGIALEIVDGGTMEGVVLSNITMRDVSTAILIRLGNRGARWTNDQEKPGIGTLRNVSIDHVVALVRERDGRSLASSITGLVGHPVEDVSLSNIRIVSQRQHARAEADIALAAIPEAEKAYPENDMFGPLPAYGLFVRHVRGLKLRNVDVSFTESDFRSALVCHDVEDLVVDAFTARSSTESKPVIVLADARRATLSNAVAPADTPVFLRVEGVSAGIALVGCNLAAARVPVERGNGVPANAVWGGDDRK